MSWQLLEKLISYVLQRVLSPAITIGVAFFLSLLLAGGSRKLLKIPPESAAPFAFWGIATVIFTVACLCVGMVMFLKARGGFAKAVSRLVRKEPSLEEALNSVTSREYKIVKRSFWFVTVACFVAVRLGDAALALLYGKFALIAAQWLLANYLELSVLVGATFVGVCYGCYSAALSNYQRRYFTVYRAHWNRGDVIVWLGKLFW